MLNKKWIDGGSCSKIKKEVRLQVPAEYRPKRGGRRKDLKRIPGKVIDCDNRCESFGQEPYPCS
ncbi:MAG: hypothetical protein P9M00_01180 [Candidatus Tritonobacter lacicola]|nr:hypothetical protein [Candidatus Tritonobacter lacicola]